MALERVVPLIRQSPYALTLVVVVAGDEILIVLAPTVYI